MLSQYYTIITICILFTLNLQKGKLTLTKITVTS
jgi:hypothetical protein